MSRDFIEEDNYKEFDYVTYGRQFDSYRWFKPILTMIFFMVFFIIFACLLAAATGAYDFIRTGEICRDTSTDIGTSVMTT